jgi:Predicted nucleotidyltransferases
MTQHDDTLYLALMRDEIRGAMGILERSSRDQFIAHDILAGAAAYHFMRLAERPLKVSPTFRADHPEIPWEDLADIRSRVEPELFREDAAAMWEIGTAEFPAIADALEALLPSDALWRYGAGDDQDELAERAESDSVPQVSIPAEALDEICRRYDVMRIRLFGSALRDDFGPESDVDMMVDFGPNAPKGWDVFRLDDELSELFGRKVDVMHGQPVRYIRAQILAEARTIYVTGCEPPG